MKLLVDTHLVLWAAFRSDKLPGTVRTLLGDERNIPVFSVVSLWEVAIKSSLGRSDFQVDPGRLRRSLLDNGWEELPIAGQHATATIRLPSLHRDPFDRLLIAQAMVEGLMLYTADRIVAGYPGSIRLV